MNTVQRTFEQFVKLFQQMTVPQRTTLMMVPLLLIGGFSMLLWNNRTLPMTALSWGKVYTTEELMIAEQALIQAGLTEFRREGQRLMVPEADRDRYNAALLEHDAMPNDLGSQMLKQYENLSPFSTDKQRQEMRDALLLQEVRRTLRAIPALDDARVVIANSGRRSTWGQKQKVTATVSVRPKASRDLSAKLVKSLQAAVASMIPDLSPADVTVFDITNSQAHTGEDANDPLSGRLVQRVKELSQQYETQIGKDLSYIPDVGVTVNVDIENLKSSVSRSQQIDPKNIGTIYSSTVKTKDNQSQKASQGEPGVTSNRPGAAGRAPGADKTRQLEESDNRKVNGLSFEVVEKHLLAAMPKAVQVSVSIPRDYYRDVAAQRKQMGETDAQKLDTSQIEKDVLVVVQRSVTRLIPAGSPPEAISVVSVDRVQKPIPELTVPTFERVQMVLSNWAPTMGLTALAIWALTMIRRSLPASVLKSEQADLDVRRLKLEEPEPVAVQTDVKAPSRRDMLQTIVRDNPEMAASVISKWVQNAR